MIAGTAFTVTTVAEEEALWQPLAFVTLTVQLPLVEMLMLAVVAPVDQR